MEKYIELIIEKSFSDLKSEARRSYIGMLWWIIEPILYMAVFYLIFVVIFDRGGEERVAFLLSGLVAWKWFATSIPQCSTCMRANIGLIRQVYIPKFIFPVMVVTTSTLKFLMVFILLLIFLLIKGGGHNITWVVIPALMSVQLLMMLAIGTILAATVPFLPDLKLIIDNAMMLLFFLSGILFDINTVSPELKTYLYLNPMVGIVDSYRSILLWGEWPDWLMLGKILVGSIIGLIVGWYLLKCFDKTYVKVL